MIRYLLPISAVFAGVVFLALNGTADVEVDSSLNKARESFTQRFPQVKAESIRPGPIDGMFEIRQGTMVAYLSTDGRYLFQGELIDLDTDINLTDQAASVERQSLMSQASADQQIVFGPKAPEYSIAVFTDIDCTFCRKLHREIADYSAQGIEIKYLLYPRGGPGSASWQKAEEVACAEDPTKAITLAKNDQLVVSKQCDLAKTVGDSYRLGGEIGLRGTPAIVLDDGTLISGYVPAKDLRERLDRLAAAASQ